MDDYVVYEHKCPNGKRYIGITSQIPNRRFQNGNGYRSNLHFYRAIQKYGWDNIEHQILCKGLDLETAGILEKFYIQKYKSNNSLYGYNNSEGGECGSDGSGKKIYLYTKNWNYVKTFNSIKHCASFFDVGIKYIYEKASKDYVIDNKYIISLKPPKYNSLLRNKYIILYDNKKDFVDLFQTINEAALKIGCSKSTIKRNIYGDCNTINIIKENDYARMLLYA